MVRLHAAFLMSVVFVAAAQSERSTVDFRNFEYPLPNMEEKGEMPATWKWLPSVLKTRVRIRNGEFREPTPDLGPGPSVRWVSTVWGDLDGDGREEAAVLLRYGTGGTATWQYLYVYRLGGKRPELMSILESGSRAQGGLVDIAMRGQAMVLRFQDEERQRGDCCSNGYIEVSYRWDVGHFLEVGKRARGSLRRRVLWEREPIGSDSVECRSMGKELHVFFKSGTGPARKLTRAGVNSQPSLSADEQSVVYLREMADGRVQVRLVQSDGSQDELLFDQPLRWKGMTCGTNGLLMPQWSADGQYVYWLADCGSFEGALWRMDMKTRRAEVFLADCDEYLVIRQGRYKGTSSPRS
ncbi:MAG: VCBS repeat-containing protein [Bryobacterales bacterium]|nr:VCBS repeat-containing protein [Bryobacterales bacterium]